MKNTQVKNYIKLREVTISQAAREIGVSRQTLYEAINGKPLGKMAAWKLSEWSEGFLDAAKLAGFRS